MDAFAKLEFVVSMTCESCVENVEKALHGNPNIRNTQIDLQNQQVVVDTKLQAKDVQNLIETTGMQAELMGMGSATEKGHLGAAVAELRGKTIRGIVRLLQLNKDLCLIDGTIDGLTPGNHGINVHEFGNLINGCTECGDHYNPHDKQHGNQKSDERHVGDLGNIQADDTGRANFRFTDKYLKVYDVIGRSFVIHEKEDDFLSVDGNSGKGIACAVIARSSGLFQNSKRFCACDGITIWEERHVPDVGPGRTVNQNML